MAEPSSDMGALERFVAENDDLLELEERIGKFNIFDALRIVRAEIRHSNFLGWLLDPSESHGQGDLFLKAILMDLLKRADPNKRPLSPIELDGETLGDVEVRREWRNIDLLIASKSPDFVLAIENKVDSGEHSGQLQRYEDIVAAEWPERRRMLVFLTVEGDDASDDDWVPYSYADIHRVLTRVRRTSGSSIGDDVLTFLDHYLNLLGSRFMDDAKLDELCRRIYQNHRRAIDLIVERVGSTRFRVAEAIRSWILAGTDRFIMVPSRNTWIGATPIAWATELGALGLEPNCDSRCWLRIWFKVEKDCVIGSLWSAPTKDMDYRNRFLDRLSGAHPELGIRPSRGKYPKLLERTIFEAGEDPDPKEAIRRANEFVESLRCIDATIQRLASE